MLSLYTRVIRPQGSKNSSCSVRYQTDKTLQTHYFGLQQALPDVGRRVSGEADGQHLAAGVLSVCIQASAKAADGTGLSVKSVAPHRITLSRIVPLPGMSFGQREDARKLIPSDLVHADTLPGVTNHSERAQNLLPRSDPTAGRAAFRDIVFRSPTLPFLGRRMEEYGLSDRQSTDASDRAVDSRVVLVRTNDRLHHFWRRTC